MATPLWAQIIPGFSGDRNQPIKIHAEELAIDHQSKEALFSGGAKAQQSGITIISQRMRIDYDSKPILKVKYLYALGNVWLIGHASKGHDAPVARGETAKYNMAHRTLTLTGKVSLEREGKILTGQELVIDMVSGHTTLNSKKAGKRVRGLFKRPALKNP